LFLVVFFAFFSNGAHRKTVLATVLVQKTKNHFFPIVFFPKFAFFFCFNPKAIGCDFLVLVVEYNPYNQSKPNMIPFATVLIF